MLGLLALALPALQEPEVPLRSQQPLELELTSADPLLQGHGPARSYAYASDTEGRLAVFVLSDDFDPFLRVTDARGDVLAEDDDGGGGTTAFLELPVRPRQRLTITVAAASGDAGGRATLSAGAWAETPQARAAAELALERLDEAEGLRRAGRAADARLIFQLALDDLGSAPGAEESKAVEECRDRIALAARALGDMGSAARARRAIFERRVRLFPPAHERLQGACYELAIALAENGDPRLALPLFEQVHELSSRTLAGDDPNLQKARHALAETQRLLGDFDRARELFEQVLEVRERLLAPDDSQLQATRLGLGATVQRLGDLDRAKALYEQALEARLRTLPGDHVDVQRVRINLATVLDDQGDRQGAWALLGVAVEALSRTLPEDHALLLASRLNLGRLCSQLGDWPQARALFERVVEVESRTLSDDDAGLQTARLALATAIQRLGDPLAARPLIEKVLEVRSRTLAEDHPDFFHLRMQLSALQVELGDMSAARALVEKELEIRSRTLQADHPNLQGARVQVALIHEALGELPAARAAYEQAIEAWSRTRPRDEPEAFPARARLAAVLAKEGRHDELETLLPEVAASLRRSLEQAALTLSPREAEAFAGELLREISVVLSLSGAAPDGELRLALVEPAFELVEASRGIARIGHRAARIAGAASADPAYASLRAAVRKSSTDIARLAAGAGGREELLAAVQEKERAERELRSAALSSGAGASILPALDARSLGARLADGEIAVGYRRYTRSEVDPTLPGGERSEESLLAFVLRRDGSLSRVELGPLQPVEAAVASYLGSIGAAAPRLDERGTGIAVGAGVAAPKAGEELRRRVLDPLAPFFGGATRLVVALDDVLHLVPLDALPDVGEGDRLVGERLEIRVRPTLSELAQPEQTALAAPSLVALGGIRYDEPPVAAAPDAASDAEVQVPPAQPHGVFAVTLRKGGPNAGFAPLSASRSEVEEIGTLFEAAAAGASRAEIVTGNRASVQVFLAAAPRARFLHLATHGWFAPESVASTGDGRPIDARTGLGRVASMQDQVSGLSPLALCGLALAGADLPPDAYGRLEGLITAEEIASIDLSGCELAVLSACDTSVGLRRAGQGVASLQTALHAAGARSAITSLWKVPDQATKELMVDFYRRAWVERKPKAQALWEAKMKLRDTRDERGVPLHATGDWAAWVLSGDPR